MRRDISVIEVCSARASRLDLPTRKQGLLAGKAATLIIEWAKMMRDEGLTDPTVADYQRWARVSHRNAWYRMEAFSTLFPEYHRPTDIARLVNADRANRLPADLAVA